MERITYQRTLDVHKNGVQFTLQGVETGDNLSRVIEISLMASGDAIDFPLEKLLPVMYVRTPNATEPSIIECTIKNNVVVYEVLPIVEEGITEMQLKLIETSPEGATSVLVAPRFAIEVTESSVDDGAAEQKSSFTALENAVAKAKTVYDQRFLRMELDSECIFRAYYADGTTYETDVLQSLFRNGNVLLSESWAKGGTGVRAGEDTNNSMYYSNVSKSEALNAKDIMADSEEILEEVKLHGVYTAFSVDFETGEVEYVSPTYKFTVNLETGELDAEGQTYTFEDDIFRVVTEWLEANGVVLSDLQAISEELKTTTETHAEEIEELQNRVTPVEKGGTGFDNIDDFVSENKLCRIETGSYTGTGTYGADNPCVLTFSGKPIFVSISGPSWTENAYVWATGMTFGDMPKDGEFCSLTWEGNTLKYVGENNLSSATAATQLNATGSVYNYVAVIL